jgi:superkiller protein 3
VLDKAISLQNAGKIPEAIQTYQEFLAKDPNNAQGHFNLGTAYQEAGKLKEALNEYKTASKLAPSNSEFSSAVIALEQAINSGVLETAEASKLLKEAVNLQQAGKIPQAISKYQESLKLDPKNAQTHFNLATAFHSSKKYSEAALEYKQAYIFDPAGYPEANYFVGNLMEAQSKTTEAIAYYKRYLEDQPQAQYSDSAKERLKLLGEN